MDTLYLLLVETLLKPKSVETHCCFFLSSYISITGRHAIIWSIHQQVHLDPGAFSGIESHLHLPPVPWTVGVPLPHTALWPMDMPGLHSVLFMMETS